MTRFPLMALVLSAAASSPGAAAAEQRVLTLDEALRAARAHHPQLAAARAETEAKTAKVNVARAPLLPQVTGSASYQRATRHAMVTAVPTSGSMPITTAGTASSNLYSVGLGVSQLLYDFGQTTGKWNAAKATLQSQEQAERNLAVEVAFNVRAAFHAAAAAAALVKVAVDNLANQELHLRQIQGFVEAGTRPEIDLAQARTDRANAQVQLINAQVGFDSAKAALNQAIGVEGTTEFDVADPGAVAVEGEGEEIDTLMGAALRARPDLQSLQRQIEAQEFVTSGLRGGYAPTLSANAGLTESGPALDDLNWGFRAMLSLNWQLFGGGVTDAQVREARASLAVLRAQYDLQRQQMRLELEQARLGVRAAKASVDAAREAAVNARVRLTLAEGRYQAGVGNVIELGDAQVAFASAAAQEVQARFNLATARAKLLLALGRP
ncbi:MAG: TolC family protein [Deltaproteobacteria bacterium]|nr:TolC family protein [Deltaproteobacteria bacterium]